jgi:hypothetical protein
MTNRGVLETQAALIVAVDEIKLGRQFLRDQRADYAGKGSN